MKRFWAFIVSLVLIAGIVVAPVQPASAASVKVKKIKLNETAVTLTITEKNSAPTVQLKATVSPKDASNKEVTWKSSDKEIAKVSKKGLVTALKAGKVTITCKAADGSGKKATCEITVKVKKTEASNETDKAKPKKIKITGSKYVAKGKKITLKATITPAKASQKVTWKSSDKKIATVSAKGVVKGIKPGKVTITATSKANKKITKSFKIEVKAKAVKKVTISGRKDLDLAGTKTVTLKAKATPKQAAQSFEWKSSDTKVATVNEKGKVTAKGVGTVKITATATDGSKKKKTVTIKVTNSIIYIPESISASSAALNELIRDYSNIPVVPGYENYRYARLLVQAEAAIPDIQSFNPVKIIQETGYYYVIQFSDPVNAKKCADFLNSQSGILTEPDEVYKSNASIDKEVVNYSNYSWGVPHIHADAYAMDLRKRGVNTSVTVAVLDTGLNTQHALFSGRAISRQGYDFVDNDDDPEDPHGHGTHVAGIIMDCTPGLNIGILPIRVIDQNDNLWKSRLGDAIKYVTEKTDAKVINMSLGYTPAFLEFTHWPIESQIKKAVEKGITVVVSAGNNDDGSSNADSNFPANVNISGCITVSAINSSDQLSGFSKVGSCVDICAPGESILSAGGNKSGTSMAAPHVAAAAAMLISDLSNSLPANIVSKLKENARDLGPSGRDNSYGAGCIDLSAFIQSPDLEPDEVPIDSAHFPDPVFITVVSLWDLNHDGILNKTERSTVEEINLSNMNIHDLKGIEYFQNVRLVHCPENHLSELHLSENHLLAELNCANNDLTSLDLSNNPKLTTLDCYDNDLKELNISNCRSLTKLDCNINHLENLSLTDNTELCRLECFDNNLSKLDISTCQPLKKIIEGSARCVKLEPNNSFDYWQSNDGIIYLFVDHNVTVIAGDKVSGPTIRIDADNFPDENFRQFIIDSKYDKNTDEWLTSDERNVVKIDCTGKSITDLKGIEYFTELSVLYCSNNQLTSLDVSKNTKLQFLWCNGNALSNLDVSKNTALIELYCHNNQGKMTELVVTNCKRLNSLVKNFARVTVEADNYDKWVSDNIEKLYLDRNVKVIAGDFISNPTDGQAPSEGIEINETNFPDENFRQLILEGTHGGEEYATQKFDADGDGYLSDEEIAAVGELYCDSKSIADLTGIQFFTELITLQCSDNQLTAIDVSQNKKLLDLDIDGNMMTSVDLSNNKSLNSLNIDHNNLENLDLSQNTSLEYLYCNSNNLNTLNLSKNTALKQLHCGSNNLNTLDISINTDLEELYCSYNNLESLDVSQNTSLYYLYCGSNNLNTLDVSHNTALEDLSCLSNKLTILNIGNITSLRTVDCTGNPLTNLDVSAQADMYLLDCDQTQIVTLSLHPDSPVAKLVQETERQHNYGTDSWSDSNRFLTINSNVTVIAGDYTSLPIE